MKRFYTGVFAILFLSFSIVAQQSLSEDIAFKIKREAFQNSQLEDLAFLLTDFAGPRLAGSKLAERGEQIAKEKLIELGFSNVRIEKAADFHRGGWDNLKTYTAMTAPYYSSLTALPKAWSGSTNGLIKGDVILLEIKKPEDISNYKGKLANKIVLMPEMYKYTIRFSPLARRYTDEQLEELTIDSRVQSLNQRVTSSTNNISETLLQQIRSFLADEKPAVIIEGRGSFNVPSSTRLSNSSYKYGDPEPIAELVLPIEAHARMVRLITKKIPVSMEVDIKNEFYNNQIINNVIAEIPGTDPKLKDEVVLIGAHLDSWHGGTGAADNSSGCMVMMEALRIIKETGVKPRRTIRVALWGGEEQEGMMGSRGYMQKYLYNVEENKPRKGYDQFALYLNMDNGSGRFRGIFLEENDMAFPFFRQWKKSLESLGFDILSPHANGGTDHVSFARIGLPAFQFIQDPLEYLRSYHTLMDTYERLLLTDLQYNAAVVALLTLSASMDDDKIPPKPLSSSTDGVTNSLIHILM